MDVNQFIIGKYNLKIDKNPSIIPGMNRRGLYQLFNELGYENGCEVGVDRGRNALAMTQEIKDVELLLIDSYKNHPFCVNKRGDKVLRKVRKITHKRFQGMSSVRFDERFSEVAVMDLEDESLDFVYIDGDHTYDFVMLDVILFSRKVRKGGIVSGHDYYESKRWSQKLKVTGAINDYTNIHKISPWFITDRHSAIERGDKYPSWFWMKQ